MSAQLVQHLKNVCNQDESVKILLSQWEFDRLLVGKALENVGSYYPHFSNHNASHSNQILINIERILGDDIKRLSATDTWLLLEAAYWHDIGMLVDAQSAKSLHTHPDFQFMVKRIAADNSHDLHAFAKEYIDKGWSAAIGSQACPFEVVEKYRQLIAEWFRSEHALRVGQITQEPSKDLGINSPRTELLPKRLYRYLGNICMAHGTSFEKMMEDLPYKQTGLGLENCHPRFVACMLRLGDLFDLDDNRFCPVMQKHVLNMPELSQRHKDKHLSIRDFQLDRTTVRVVAECEDEMVFVETQTWFDWIREEFQQQMSQWKLIAPEREFGLLPTLEKLEVKMIGKKILIDHKPMKFTLNERQVLELLEGSGLYQKNIHAVREAVQNSIDATLKRIWMQYSDKDFFKDMHPYDKEFQEIAKKFPIYITVEEIKEEEADTIFLRIVIKDQGVGFSLNDLKNLSQVGGGGAEKSAFKVDQMPEWMKPSGEFGIGMQSYFLLSKKLDHKNRAVEIKTRSLVDMREYKVELNSPLSPKKGYCFIEEGGGFGILDFGSEIKFHASLQVGLVKIIKEIEDVFKYSPIPIFANKQKISDEVFENFFWLKELGGYIFLLEPKEDDRMEVIKDISFRQSGVGFFRGARVEGFSMKLGRLFKDKGLIFYNGNARDMLIYNRSAWLDSFYSSFFSESNLEKIFSWFLSDFDKNGVSEDFIFSLRELFLNFKSLYPNSLVGNNFEFLYLDDNWILDFFGKSEEFCFDSDDALVVFQYESKGLMHLFKNYCIWHSNIKDWLGLKNESYKTFELVVKKADCLGAKVIEVLKSRDFSELKLNDGYAYVKCAGKEKADLMKRNFVAVIKSCIENGVDNSIDGLFEKRDKFYLIHKDVVNELFEGLLYKADKDFFMLPFAFSIRENCDNGGLTVLDNDVGDISDEVDYKGDNLEGFVIKMRKNIKKIIKDVEAHPIE